MGHETRKCIAKQESGSIYDWRHSANGLYTFHIWMLKNKEDPWWIKRWLLKFMKNTNNKNLLKFAIKHISCQYYVHTGLWKGYRNFKLTFPNHEAMNHQDSYVSKNGVNTNQIQSV